MYKTLIRPVVLYGYETWNMLEEDLQALGVFKRRVLRTIFGGVQENGVWQRRMNHELAALYGEPSIQKVAKAGRIRYQKAGSRGTLSSIWDICVIAKIIAYFIIYLREKEGNKDKDGDKDR